MKRNHQLKTTLFFIMAFYLIFSVNQLCYAATFYISPDGSDSTGDGSSGNPWASPVKARKSTGAITAGDTVIFKNGNYSYSGGKTCRLGFNGDDSGSSGFPITYKAETRGSVTIDFNKNWGWSLSTQAEYIILDGFNLVQARVGVDFISAAGCEARYVNITATATWPPTGSPFAGSEGNGGFRTLKGSSFLIENSIVDTPGSGSSQHGVYIQGGSGTLRDSTFRNANGSGILIQAKNVDFDIGTVNIYRNRSHNNAGTGIALRSDNALSKGVGTIGTANVYNNLVYANGQHGIAAVEVNGGSTTANIYNNTIFNNSAKGLWHNASGSVKNIISVNNSPDIDFNTLSNTSIVFSNYLDTTSLPSSNFVSTVSSNSNYLKLKGSATAAIDQGTNTGISDDFFSNSRPRFGGVDIGAHEYTVDAPKNLSLSLE